QRAPRLPPSRAMARALTAGPDLADLVARVCRHAGELCGADRTILYILREGPTAEILAVSGWQPTLLHEQGQADLFSGVGDGQPRPFRGWPPGIPERHADVEGAALRAGLRVP